LPATAEGAPRASGLAPRARRRDTERLRLATMGGLFARQRRSGAFAIVWRGADGVAPDRAAQAARGGRVRQLRGDVVQDGEEPVAWLERVESSRSGASQGDGARTWRVLGECTNMAARCRTSRKRPHPREFAERASTLRRQRARAEVLDEKKIAELKMGSCSASRAAASSPAGDRPSSRAKKPLKGRGLGLVGKGSPSTRRHLDQSIRQHGK